MSYPQARLIAGPPLNYVRALFLPALLAYGLLVDPVSGEGGIPCLWRLLFDVVCPGCGLGRADAFLVRGRLGEALAMNWLIVPVVLVALYSFAGEVSTQFRNRRRDDG